MKTSFEFTQATPIPREIDDFETDYTGSRVAFYGECLYYEERMKTYVEVVATSLGSILSQVFWEKRSPLMSKVGYTILAEVQGEDYERVIHFYIKFDGIRTARIHLGYYHLYHNTLHMNESLTAADLETRNSIIGHFQLKIDTATNRKNQAVGKWFNLFYRKMRKITIQQVNSDIQTYNILMNNIIIFYDEVEKFLKQELVTKGKARLAARLLELNKVRPLVV